MAGLALFAASPAGAAWLRAESDNFIVYSDSSENRLREQVQVLEDYAAVLRRLTGTTDPPSPNKLPVYLVGGLGDLRQVVRVAGNVGGFYRASPHGTDAFANSNALALENAVVFHEYAHHFMLQHMARPSRPGSWRASPNI